MDLNEAVFVRAPGIAWREEKEARQEVMEALEQGADVAGEGTLIVVDKGQIFELNLLGAEIWKLCDGEKSVAEIVVELLASYDIEREELEGDIREFLGDVEERGWLVRR